MRISNRELKPCPFCGDEVKEASINHCIGWVEQMSVYCTGCGSQITVRASEVRYWRDGSPDEDAVDVWNKRAGDEK